MVAAFSFSKNYGVMMNPLHQTHQTYIQIHIWPLQLFSQNYGLAMHTTYVVCVSFIHKRLSLKPTPKDRFVRSFSWQFYYLQRFCQKSAERKSPKKYFHNFILMSDLRTFPLIKPTYIIGHYNPSVRIRPSFSYHICCVY